MRFAHHLQHINRSGAEFLQVVQSHRRLSVDEQAATGVDERSRKSAAIPIAVAEEDVTIGAIAVTVVVPVFFSQHLEIHRSPAQGREVFDK